MFPGTVLRPSELQSSNKPPGERRKSYMNQLINLKTTNPAVRTSLSPTTAGRGFLVVVLAFAYFALLPAPKALGVTPAPDGGYPGNNTPAAKTRPTVLMRS